jgi:hypothetical protein
MKTRTLFDRYIARVRKAESIMHPNQHVRAELQRVARQVRKSIKLWQTYKEKDSRKEERDCWDSRIAGAQDVLALLKEAQR